MKSSTNPCHSDNHLAIQHNSIILVLEPLDGSGLTDFLVNANLAATVFAFSNSSTWPSEDHVKVHCMLGTSYGGDTSVDTNSRIILDVQVDVFLDTESKVTSLAKVSFLQLVLFDFESTFENFLSLS